MQSTLHHCIKTVSADSCIQARPRHTLIPRVPKGELVAMCARQYCGKMYDRIPSRYTALKRPFSTFTDTQNAPSVEQARLRRLLAS